ncbi:hypothetical protein [Chondromyces apiculatus]|uniref:Flagellar hook-length control protein FliK n=1 Tax=Chondromyces apiculatus DSM 436 TaxID=1192034 RepID=A0A017TB16_9BACT|nr:hypothetical protein [Chondromyces apiculatus]EYF06478.1 Flagellar hook-length control protein FliK [Chondromyces apiculatus DSM 436]
MKPLRSILVGVSVVVAAAMPAACGALELDFGHETSGDAGFEGVGGAGGSGGEGGSVNLGTGETSPDPYQRFAHLCGGECKPGDPEACASSDDGGEGGSGGAGGSDPDTGTSVTACQLVPGDASRAEGACGATGAFAAGEPCESAADCAPGLGCAATGGMAGTCREYCCGNVEACASGTFCAEQTMQEDTAVPIPVCVPATGCTLLTESCGPGQTCTIVRADGTTSCVPIGAGGVGDECPCGDGFVCSMLTNQCKKLCRLGESAADCGANATCQGGSMGFPTGYGVCIGGDY